MAGLGEVDDEERSSYDFFGSSQVLQGLAILAQTRREALASPNPALRAVGVEISGIIVDLDARLRNVAVRVAQVADEAAAHHLAANQRRPDTNKGIHLRDCIKSRPNVLGSVNVFLFDELNRAINEGSDRSYWEVIEEGSATIYPEFLGRVLQGVFRGPGHDDRPRAEFGGAEHPPGATFEFADPLIEGGRGVVSHEIEPVHYLKTGADEAFAVFVRETNAAVKRANVLLSAVAV